MLKIGDMVKVIDNSWEHGVLHPIGSIGTVISVEVSSLFDDLCIGVLADSDVWYYFPYQLEKGHFEWVKEN